MRNRHPGPRHKTGHDRRPHPTPRPRVDGRTGDLTPRVRASRRYQCVGGRPAASGAAVGLSATGGTISGSFARHADDTGGARGPRDDGVGDRTRAVAGRRPTTGAGSRGSGRRGPGASAGSWASRSSSTSRCCSRIRAGSWPTRRATPTSTRIASSAASGRCGIPNIGLGTVTHQNIGYLFPLGPFYWVTHGLLGMPAWVAQRLWFATLLFAAGMGVRYLLRTLDVRGPGVPVAMLAYALSPYATEFSARLSVLLGPWAALGFFLGFTIRALRDVRGWKYPALIAITVQIVGGVNATALLYALIAPALWVPYAVWVRRELTWRDAWSAIWRTGLLTALTSLWWVVGLLIEGSYGMGILRFTESVEVVSHTSTATEILRGLGYWFFYGGDLRGPWNDGVLDFTRRTTVIFVSFAIPALAMLAAGFLRWKHRAFFIGLVLIGMVIAVAASPYDDPTVLGSLFKAFATSSTAGFALRSTARAVPMLVLGLAVLLGIGISAWWEAMAARGRGVDRGGRGRGGRGAVRGERAGPLARPVLQHVPRTRRAGPDVLEAGAAGARRQGRRHPRARAARRRLRRVPVGRHDRPDRARAHGPAVRRPRAGPVGRRRHDQPADRARPARAGPARSTRTRSRRSRGSWASATCSSGSTSRPTSSRSSRRAGCGRTSRSTASPAGLGAPTTFGTKIPGRLIGTDLGDPAEPPTPEPKPVAVFPVAQPQKIVRVHPPPDRSSSTATARGSSTRPASASCPTRGSWCRRRSTTLAEAAPRPRARPTRCCWSPTRTAGRACAGRACATTTATPSRRESSRCARTCSTSGSSRIPAPPTARGPSWSCAG